MQQRASGQLSFPFMYKTRSSRTINPMLSGEINMAALTTVRSALQDQIAKASVQPVPDMVGKTENF